MTQVGGVLKTMAKDFNVAVLVRMLRRRGGSANSTLRVTLASVAGDQPRDEEHQRGGAAGPRDVLEPHPQNQDPAGGGGARRLSQLPQSALCHPHQVFQTGTGVHGGARAQD